MSAKRNTRKQRGGYDTVPGSVIPTPSQTPFAQLMKGGSASSSASATPSVIPSVMPFSMPSSSTTPSSTPVTGGARKLQLAPKKEVLKLVKKSNVKPAEKVIEKPTDKSADRKSKTRKVIRIQMGHLRKSMKRASDITKSSKEKSIEEIEDLLVREKILRKRSADRPMSDGRQQTLRGMYRDYVQLRSNLM